MKRRCILAAMMCVAATAMSHAKVETMQAGSTVVRLEFYTPHTVHVVKTPAGKDYNARSLVVTAHPGDVAVSRKGNSVSSNVLTVSVDPATGIVAFAAKGQTLLRESQGAAFEPITSGPEAGRYHVTQAFALDADEPLYGVGMLQNGKLDHRGENRLMMQSNLEDYANVFQSIKGYGIYWDNYSPTQLDSRSGLTLTSQVGDDVDYYFIYGATADGVVKQLRHLTGHAPMVPLWTYGFHQSRERYKSQEELLDVVRTYRKRGIPLDGIIQDWQYWGSNYTWNAMEFLNEDFQQAQRMIDEVHDTHHAHMSISIWQSFGPHTKGYRQMNERGYLMDFETWPQSGLPMWPPRMDYPSGVRVYNPFAAEARDIYWENLSRLHAMGIDAWWMDSTDPDHHSFKDSDLDQVIATTPGANASYRALRNAFPLACVEGVYDHQRATSQEKRVFILTRSYFAGQQRTGANTWSGDIGSSWDSFRKQVPLCLSHTLTGNPQVNTDIGGFFAGAYNTLGANSAVRNPQFQELYARWMQFGALCPMMRSHGTDIHRELYYFGQAGDPIYDALVDAVRLRYRLLPYIYSTAWQVTHADDSFMRPLVMDFAQDSAVWRLGSQYLFGRSLMAVPVLHPLYTKEKIVATNELTGWNRNEPTDRPQGKAYPAVDWTQAKTYDAYLPQGTDWYDFWTGQRLSGGRHIAAQATIAHSPLFVRAGSILPLGPDVQWVQEKAWDDLEIIVYPGADGAFTLYEDEGDSYRYEQGAYTEIPMTWNDRARKLTIGKRKGVFPGMIATRRFRIHTPDGDTHTVSYSGKAVSIKL